MKDIEKAYIAGFFDGEGCISLQAYYQEGKYGKFPRINMQINITQVNHKVLEYIQQFFGGKIHKGYKDSDKRSDCYKLTITGKINMEYFLDSIKEYVIVKKEDIKYGLEFINTLRSDNLGCVPLPEDIHELRRNIYNKMSRRRPFVPTRGDSCEQTPNMLEHPERAISRHRLYSKASETTKEHLSGDDGIVRAAWEHAESGRNDQIPEMGNNTDTVIM